MNTLNSKYKRGQKFEIEIAEVHTHYTDHGVPFSMYRAKGFDSLVLTDKGLDALTEVKSNDCGDCKYSKCEEWEEPCLRCMHSHIDCFRPKE